MNRTTIIIAIIGIILAVAIGSMFFSRGSEDPGEVPRDGIDDPVPVAQYVGNDTCSGCHKDIHNSFQKTYHPRKVGPVTEIAQESLENWGDLPDERGNPVVFDQDEPTGIAETRDINLTDGTNLTDINGVFVRYEGDFQFIADYYNGDGEVVHSQEVSPYHIGAKYRQAYAVNLEEGEGSRLLKYQFSLDDYQYQYEWRDRNQARIYEFNCIGCHVVGFDLESWEGDKDQPLEAITASLGVGCESCHGPGSIHADNPTDEDGIVRLAELTKDQQVHNCSQCHIRGTSDSHPGRQDNIDFKPGDNVLDNFTPMPVTWGDATQRVAGDGKARASRQQFMDHYIGVKSDMKCTDCHSYHSNNEEGELFFDELSAICASCHGDTFGSADEIRAFIDGRTGWDDTSFTGWRMQHTYRVDDEGRVIGLLEEEWPDEDVWPWELEDWEWDFE